MDGKYAKENKKGPGFLSGLLVGLLAALVIMLAIQHLPKLMDITPSAADTSTQPSVSTEAPTESTSAQQSEGSASDIQIDTPYCTLHYPAQWSQDVKIQTDETPEKFSVTVTGRIGDREAALFAVVFGESEEMPIGTLVCDDGTEVTVRLNLELFDPDGSWTEEEIDRAYEMIDGSAYMIEALAELDNFR